MSTDDALLYESSSKKLQYAHAKKVLQHVPVGEGDRVIDIGCGTGNLVKLLREKVGSTGRVVGIDPSKKRIDVAIDSCKSFSNVDFQVCKSNQMQAAANEFDFAISFFVFHWIPLDEKLQTIQMIYDCLKKGGTFCGMTCSSMPYGNVKFFFEQCGKYAEGFSEILKSRFHIDELPWLQENFQKAGFDCVCFEEIVERDGIGSSEKFIDWLVSTYSEAVGERFNLKELWSKMNGDQIEWEQCNDGIVLSCKTIKFTVCKPFDVMGCNGC